MAYQYINKGTISKGGEYDGSADPTSGLQQDSLWEAYDKLNTMLYEIYGYSASAEGPARRFPGQTINLVAQNTYTLTTTLDEEPWSIMVEDSNNEIITDTLTISYSMATGVCVLSIYSTDSITVTVKIIY